MPQSAPLSDAIIVAVAELIDDSQEEGWRDPSHWDLEDCINRASVAQGDPKQKGSPVGKAKRIRQVLNWAQENKPSAGEELIANLISVIQGFGGFRSNSQNYVGREAFENAVNAFRAEGYVLGSDGNLIPETLDSLSGTELAKALEVYVRRAQRGTLDAALVTGTGKDLLEAVAKHVLVQKNGQAPETSFPGLLGLAFVALGMATPQDSERDRKGEASHRRMERALFKLACSVNSLRNKEGTGHGRPFLPSVSDSQARTAVESMGTIAGYMLANL